MQLSATVVEKQLNNYLSKLTYAALKDIEAGWNDDEVKYDPNLYQSYENILRDKDDTKKLIRPKHRFTIAKDTIQYLSFLFNRLIKEIKDVPLGESNEVASILAAVAAGTTDCYTEFMFHMTQYREHFGATLKAANDPNMWFHTQIVAALPMYYTRQALSVNIHEEFDQFLKSLAWIFSKFVWYNKMNIVGNVFLAMMAQHGMSQILIDMMRSCLREKPPTKPRAKKAGAAQVASEATTPTIELSPADIVEIALDECEEI